MAGKEVTWREIPGYPGYLASNTGLIKSLPKPRRTWEKVLKPNIKKDGYSETVVYLNGKPNFMKTHRLIAMAFIDNPEGKPEINHKDGNKLNNCVENLEWVTPSENQKHAYRAGLQKVSGNAISGKKAIRCIDLNVTKSGLSEMQRYLCEQGYTNTTRLNRLSDVMNKGINEYLGMRFEYEQKQECNRE